MRYRVVIHAEAAQELREVYDYIADRAGAERAWSYVSGLQQFLERLADFPERGTVRGGAFKDMRIIGYRRRMSIAFVVRAHTLMVLGFLYAGKDLRPERLAARAKDDPQQGT
ncbi:type II toxin-antitoxin system RelE/ParE family toxin [Affinirhizobium pseudoryzae]|uniref:type II toxin-antitoxin system RelE/ParE family toxin n=1 Tax=Allorhizobium pseudoryzae TaxID=379684 RepID=UPI0013EB28BC|nr:type II toxin-antitoxin system RelE/ParE family toxin [Allorhizobium pseudoryzae]